MPADPQALPAVPASAPPRPLPSRLPRRSLGLLLPALLLGGVELAVRAGWVQGHLLPAPSDVLQALLGLGGADVAGHVLASAGRVALGFLCGAVLALAVGTL
ncbi:ABC transporter permease, partial [Salmonella enterica subsp. enterica serovar Enteritidis]|nr:ABC transporter permease [Salmonella enterica subsp. enterica serovar Enteritidis]